MQLMDLANGMSSLLIQVCGKECFQSTVYIVPFRVCPGALSRLCVCTISRIGKFYAGINYVAPLVQPCIRPPFVGLIEFIVS